MSKLTMIQTSQLEKGSALFNALESRFKDSETIQAMIQAGAIQSVNAAPWDTNVAFITILGETGNTVKNVRNILGDAFTVQVMPTSTKGQKSYTVALKTEVVRTVNTPESFTWANPANGEKLTGNHARSVIESLAYAACRIVAGQNKAGDWDTYLELDESSPLFREMHEAKGPVWVTVQSTSKLGEKSEKVYTQGDAINLTQLASVIKSLANFHKGTYQD